MFYGVFPLSFEIQVFLGPENFPERKTEEMGQVGHIKLRMDMQMS